MEQSECNPKTDSTFFDTDSPPDSARDSLNSLLEKSSQVNSDCAENCLDVEVKCSLTDQCPVSCEDTSKSERRKSFCCNTVIQSVWGVLLLLMSIGGFIFTPQDFMLWEKLNMRPGFPPYEWWADPPDEVRLRVFVFNVTNHQRFLAGLDHKLDVQEVGPIVYLEKLLHYNIKFNENSTLTYTAKRYLIYLPEENHINLNDTLVVPNLAVLGIASYLHSANFMVRGAFHILVNSHGSEMFVKKSIYEYLWEYREPVLETSKNIVPGLVPVDNMGMLARIYADFTDDVTVKIGPQWGHQQFFNIDRFRGEPLLPGYDPNKCPDRIFGSTEGVMYSQHLSKTDVLLYVRKTVCKLMPLHFDTEMTIDDIPVYRYNLSEHVYDRVTNGVDCYDTVPSLPPGLSDGSKCYFDFPMVISYPHFYTGGLAKDLFVTGLKPDRFKHNSFAVVEPLTGTPFYSVARMQSNLRMHDMSRFSRDYQKFSNLVIPLFWAEYSQESLPAKIRKTIFFTVVILPPLSTAILTATLLVGAFLILKQIYIHKLRNDSLNTALKFKSMNINNTLADNKLFYEKEIFLPS